MQRITFVKSNVLTSEITRRNNSPLSLEIAPMIWIAAKYIDDMYPLLLTWFNFNPGMDK